METISLSSLSQGVSGTSSLYVTNQLSDIAVKADGKAVSSLNVDGGQTVQFSQTATYNGKNVAIGQKNFQYTLTGDPIGTISDTGLLTIDEDASGSAVLSIASGVALSKRSILRSTVFFPISAVTGLNPISLRCTNRELSAVQGAGKFSPESDIRRADFMVMLYRAAGSPAAEDGDDEGFADVQDDAYYAEAVKWAKSLGIAKGDGTNFRPMASMTREDAFCFLDRYLEEAGIQLTEPSGEELNAFSDGGEVSEYAKESVAALTAAGIVNGSGGKIRPQGMLTRAEMCKILSVSLKK